MLQFGKERARRLIAGGHLGVEGVRRGLQNESRRADAASGLFQQPRSAGRALLQSHVPGFRRRPGDVRRSDPGRIFAAKPLAKLQIRIRHARLCVSPRNLAAYRSTDGKAGLGYGMAFERAANDPTAAPTEMMPRFAFRNERNDSDAISTAAISCVTHGSGEIGITKAKRYQCVYQKPYQ